MKVNIELPFFPGFYESDLENSDTPYWAIKEELQYYQEECDTPCKELTESDIQGSPIRIGGAGDITLADD